jgi:hypothetical protein
MDPVHAPAANIPQAMQSTHHHGARVARTLPRPRFITELDEIAIMDAAFETLLLMRAQSKRVWVPPALHQMGATFDSWRSRVKRSFARLERCHAGVSVNVFAAQIRHGYFSFESLTG